MMLRCCNSSCTSSHIWCSPLMSIRAQLTLFGGWSKDPCLRIFIQRVLKTNLAQWQDLDACSRLAVAMGKQFPQKPVQAHCTDCQEHLAQKKRECRWGFLHFQSKVRAYSLRKLHFQGNAKTTVICGIKSMSNTANVENAGSINNPPGCFW